MEAKERIILDAEENFARRVALGAIVRRPVKPLLQLIPGMFIIDFLKRTYEIRKYTRYYMFPRKAALEKASRAVRGQRGETPPDGIEEKTGARLESGALKADAAHSAFAAIVLLLSEHYTRLLGADGEDYRALTRSAYGTRLHYRTFLNELLSLEGVLDKILADGAEDRARAPLEQRLQEERQQVEEQRKKEIEDIFLA